MRAVVQRVLAAEVRVDGKVVGAVAPGDGPGLLVYLGVTHDDGDAEVAWTARKVWETRLLRDERSASEVGAPVLVVSQFTLYGDARKGRRPTWAAAAPRPVSEPLVDAVVAELRRLGARVETGVFGADMQVSSTNDGPVTLLLETP
ncbi:D-aminoacyl-tRNA deacylase [Nocardioides perillae]|uniref:D-aminoacyl-tRNA deacylase n=1 Tax=Nocardioides perillae TaxID=1119534 RepID=UPI0015CD28E1